MRALGRPNREQVTTRRESVATTLQALELTNGGTLDEMLKAGASEWVQREKRADALVRRVYETALGRPPNERELAIGRGLVGETPTHEGVQDLLWVIAMLPEFQLIY
jgi:hypothetical protein